jgi:choline dehydrogenase-like flavoprotein
MSAPRQKSLNFTKHLVGFWRDLEDNQHCKYDELSRAQLQNLIDHEMAPGNTVDNGKALRTNIVSSVPAYLYPTSTVPMGADLIRRLLSTCGASKALRVVDASILPDIPSVPMNVTTIRVVERIAATKLSAERPVLGFRWGETAA